MSSTLLDILKISDPQIISSHIARRQINLFKEHGISKTTLLHEYVKMGRIDLAEAALRNVASEVRWKLIYTADLFEDTPFQIACERGILKGLLGLVSKFVAEQMPNLDSEKSKIFQSHTNSFFVPYSKVAEQKEARAALLVEMQYAIKAASASDTQYIKIHGNQHPSKRFKEYDSDPRLGGEDQFPNAADIQ